MLRAPDVLEKDLVLVSQQDCPGFLTELEAANYLGVSKETIRRWRRERRGPEHYRIGRIIRYSTQALERFVAAHTEAA